MSQYIAYIGESGEAFFNPDKAQYGLNNPEIGSEINGTTVVALGTIEQVTAVCNAINARLPKVAGLFEE